LSINAREACGGDGLRCNLFDVIYMVLCEEMEASSLPSPENRS